MPAAVAVPLITSAVGAGVGLFQQKKQNDANKKLAETQAASANANTGGDGGSSYSSGGGSWSKGGTVIDPAVRDLAYGGASSFLQDGGLSQADLASMRARAVSPVRAAYSNARREVDRSSALSGGYAPNKIAALTRMGREQGQLASDAANDAESNIVGMRQQGKMAGLNAATSMYANMPTFNESQSWNSSSGGSGGGGTDAPITAAPSKGGFWNTLGNIGRVALPIGLNAWDNMSKNKTNIPSPKVNTGWGNNMPGTNVGYPSMPTQNYNNLTEGLGW